MENNQKKMIGIKQSYFNRNFSWTLFISVLMFAVIYSCSSDGFVDGNETSDIVKSDEFTAFTSDCELAMDKFVSYANTLTQDEFDELMYNLNNDDYMSEVVNRAGLEEDLQRIVKSKKHLLENKNYVLLDDNKQFTLFYDHASPIQKNNVSIKTRTEGDGGLNECEQRQLSDYSWARAKCDLALVGCTCMVEVPLAACLCYAAALANYADDIRLADRSYEDCIRNLNK